ncbi:MAG: acyltransferase [Bacteroidetes bacterium]|nr:acyltransferase [Bacteroidota bacterium]
MSDEKSGLRLALIQTDSRLCDLKSNTIAHRELARKAIESGANLVIFPELSLSGYQLMDATYDLAITPDSSLFDEFKPLSMFAPILTGAPERGADGQIFNSVFLIDNGEVRVVHRKRYLPTYNVFDESRFFSAGKEIQPADTRVGKLGILICEDSWHPTLAWLHAQQQADLLIIMAASPYRSELAVETLDIRSKWKAIAQSYAITLSLPVAVCNRVGSEDGILFWGGSAVYKAGGQQLAEAPLFEPTELVATLNTQDRNRERYSSTHFLDDDQLWFQNQTSKLSKT